jgi:hypothetical protein
MSPDMVAIGLLTSRPIALSAIGGFLRYRSPRTDRHPGGAGGIAPVPGRSRDELGSNTAVTHDGGKRLEQEIPE